MRRVIRQSLKRAFVSLGNNSAVYVKRGQFFPRGVQAPEPCEHRAIGALLACADEPSMRWPDEVSVGDAQEAYEYIWRGDGCYDGEWPQRYRLAASLLASNPEVTP